VGDWQSEVSGTAKVGMHEQKLHTRQLGGGQGSTSYRRLVIYRNKPKPPDVDASSFNGKRMHLTEGDLRV